MLAERRYIYSCVRRSLMALLADDADFCTWSTATLGLTACSTEVTQHGAKQKTSLPTSPSSGVRDLASRNFVHFVLPWSQLCFCNAGV